jgi:acyl-[acyl-carrier-protein]-phospholipid O-acyltransferase/long-chain-fatty-acid--[acyl-carrier-protein] ligase
MKSHDAAALIAGMSEALVTLVRLAGPERTLFSRVSGAYVGRRLFPKVTVTVLPPRRLATPAGLRGRARRQAGGPALFDMMLDLGFVAFDIRRTVFADSAKARGLSRVAVEDPLSGALTLRAFRIGVAVLARKVAAISAPGDDRRDAAQRQLRRGDLHFDPYFPKFWLTKPLSIPSNDFY